MNVIKIDILFLAIVGEFGVLEKVLEKKKSMVEENEQLIINVDLNGSQISHDSLVEFKAVENDSNDGHNVPPGKKIEKTKN